LIWDYLLRLAIMLPLICAMIVGGLWLAKRYNLGGLSARAGSGRSVARLTETVVLSPGIRLAVVDFADKRLLLAVTKQGANLLSETAAPAFKLEEGGNA
jgi:flagellar protein FliO/FliZ